MGGSETLRRALAWLALGSCLAGCPSAPPPPEHDASTDAATDAGADATGPTDAGPCAMPDRDGDGERSMACGGLDCDDADPARHPGATEVCDTTDRDEDCDPSTFGVRDADGDGTPDARCCNVDALGTRHCGTDCDDAAAGVSPHATEVCDGVDDDCDTAIDEGVRRTFYADADHDGFGNPATATPACLPPTGTVENATDCDDANPYAHVSSDPEVCDMQDNDCDGIVDESASAVQWFVDADMDLYGDAHDPAPVTSCTPVAGHVSNAGDCDDGDAAVHPGATERCNVRDDDCSLGGGADPSEDADHDGYAPTTATCLGGLPPTDCADTDASVHPGAGFGSAPVCPTTGAAGPTVWCAERGCCIAAGAPCRAIPVPTACVASGWDLDCDGTDEPQPSFAPSDCTMVGSGTCEGSGLTYTGSPACGSDVEQVACYWSTSAIACDFLRADPPATAPLPCR